MNENQLRKYWYPAYVDALRLLKNHDKVTESIVANMVKKYGDTVFNRLFCLVVWQEIKRIRCGNASLPMDKYSAAITDAWHLFRDYSQPNESEEFWDKLIDAIRRNLSKYGNGQFVINLFINVTLEEIERISKII